MFDKDTGWYANDTTFRRQMSCPDNRFSYVTGRTPNTKKRRSFKAAIGCISGVWWSTVNEPEERDSEQRFGDGFATKEEAQNWCWTNLEEIVNGVGR